LKPGTAVYVYPPNQPFYGNPLRDDDTVVVVVVAPDGTYNLTRSFEGDVMILEATTLEGTPITVSVPAC
jgi:hypothetical protein